ncbi:MAG: sigma-54 dependent transcriptional regulator [Desulfuromonadales bacterium]|nr:sigma-54 dependent transcriptional regulator [Desulfuromonadales bacterium]
MGSSSQTVLLVDDDASLRRVTEYNLQQAGYQVLTAVDGSEGLERFRAERPAVVITDIQMPGLTGQELLQQIKVDSPETLVIVITAFGSVETAVEAMKAGAFDYLTKPFSRDEVSLTVARAFKFLGLQSENRQLRDQLSARQDFGQMVGLSEAMQEVFALVRKVAPSEASVLITGESGTGKELVARALHQGSDRSDGPFVAVNCAAIPGELLESELFGHVKGSFTGAARDRVGKFEQADGGTLFLDEIGEMPLDLQPKLLRVLQDRLVEPVGGRPRGIDVRLVTATNLDIEAAVADNRFREDLYYRLAVIPIELPSLRERRDDIPLLIRHFVERYAADRPIRIDDKALAALQAFDWPGNVRELENAVQRLCVLHRGESVSLAALPAKLRGMPPRNGQVLNLPDDGYALEEIEREAVLQALQRNDWNQTRAAAFLRIPRHTLIYRMEKYGIRRG